MTIYNMLLNFFRKSEEDTPIHVYLRLLLAEAVIRKADKILFGIPSDSLPLADDLGNAPCPPIVGDECISRDEHTNGTNVRWPQCVDNNTIPIWLRMKDKWNKLYAVTAHMLYDLLAIITESDMTFRRSMPSAYDCKTRPDVLYLPLINKNEFVEAKFLMENNYCYSIEILSVHKDV